MTSKSKTLKTKVTPAAKKPAAKTPAKVVKAIANKKEINQALGKQIKAAVIKAEVKAEINSKIKEEAIKKAKPILKSVFGNENNKAVIVTAKKKAVAKKAPEKKATKPTTPIKTTPAPKPTNMMGRSKLIPASATTLKSKAITPQAKSQVSSRTISMSDLAKNISTSSNSVPKVPTIPNVPVKRDEQVAAPYLRTPTPVKGKALSMQEVLGRLSAPVLGGNFFPTK